MTFMRFIWTKWGDWLTISMILTRGECWDEFETVMKETFKLRRSGGAIPDPPSSLKQALVGVLIRVLRMQARLQITKQSDELSLRLGGPEEEGLMIRVVGGDETLDVPDQITIKVPWSRSHSASGVELTACGAMVLAYLIGRSFLKSSIEGLRVWIA